MIFKYLIIDEALITLFIIDFNHDYIVITVKLSVAVTLNYRSPAVRLQSNFPYQSP